MSLLDTRQGETRQGETFQAFAWLCVAGEYVYHWRGGGLLYCSTNRSTPGKKRQEECQPMGYTILVRGYDGQKKEVNVVLSWQARRMGEMDIDMPIITNTIALHKGDELKRLAQVVPPPAKNKRKRE